MYDADAVRELFEKWGHEPVAGDPGALMTRWAVPHVNHIILDRWLPEQGRALDAGCGLGIETVLLVRRGLSVTALDISAALLRRARERAELAGVVEQVSFVRADITEPLPVPPASFDLCLALTGVVSHTGARHAEALAGLVAATARGGLLIVGVASYYGKLRECIATARLDEAERLADTHRVHTVSDEFEDWCFTAAELTEQMQALGCRVQALYAAPTVGAQGYVGASDDAMRRGLALDERFLGLPELVDVGEEIVGVFERA